MGVVLVEKLMIEGWLVGGGVFFSKQPSNLSGSESRQSITGWSNYAMMKLFEGHSSQYLIDYARTAFPGIAITDSRDFISPMPIGY